MEIDKVDAACWEYFNLMESLAREHGILDEHLWSYFSKHRSYLRKVCFNLPVRCIVIGQSPYPRDIYPDSASAMSYDPDLTSGTYQEVPATVAVIAEDASQVTHHGQKDVIGAIREGYRLVGSGVLLVNAHCFFQGGTRDGDIESISLIKFLATVIYAGRSFGCLRVDVFSMGKSARECGERLRSYVDRTSIRIVLRHCVHPASVARRARDSESPLRTLGAPAFTKELCKFIMAPPKDIVTALEASAFKRDVEALATAAAEGASSMETIIDVLRASGQAPVPADMIANAMSSVVKSFIEVSMSARAIVMMADSSFPQARGDDTWVTDMVSSVATRQYTGDVGHIRTSSNKGKGAASPSVSSLLSASDIRKRRAAERKKSESSDTRSYASDVALPVDAVRDGDSTSAGDVNTPDSSTAPSIKMAFASRGLTGGAATPTPGGPPVRKASSISSQASSPSELRRRNLEARKVASLRPMPRKDEASEMAQVFDYLTEVAPDSNTKLLANQLVSPLVGGRYDGDFANAVANVLRKEQAKDANFSVAVELGLATGSIVNVIGNLYQVCLHYPDHVLK